MKIEAVRPFWHAGQPVAPGARIDLPDALGIELIGLRKAIAAAEPEPQPETNKPARRKAADKADADAD